MKRFILTLVFFTTCAVANDTYSHATLCRQAYMLLQDIHYISPADAKTVSDVVHGLQRWPMHRRSAFVLPAHEKQEQLKHYHKQIEQVKHKTRSKSLSHFPQERMDQLRADEIDDIMPQRNSQ